MTDDHIRLLQVTSGYFLLPTCVSPTTSSLSCPGLEGTLQDNIRYKHTGDARAHFSSRTRYT
jgi:hypothetical protein